MQEPALQLPNLKSYSRDWRGCLRDNYTSEVRYLLNLDLRDQRVAQHHESLTLSKFSAHIA